MRKLLTGIAAGVVVASLAVPATAAEITGAGSTFVYPVLSKWAAVYGGVSGTHLNYQSIGSGGGIAQIKAKTVAFGASDMPMKPKDLEALGMVQFPIINGADVPVVNVSGVRAGELVLDSNVVANIFLGHITRWDDPAIRNLNPKLKLPSQAILVVHRSDGSGTTFIWTNYLSKVSKEWAQSVGSATSVDWPVGVGAKGNEGVAGNVAQTSGAIGYVEFAYAKQNRLSFTRMINSSGTNVLPNGVTFEAAAASTNWGAADHFYVILTNAPGKDAWPIAGSTFILMYKQPSDPATSGEVLKFFKWGLEKGGDPARALDYVPLPENAVRAIEQSWSQIHATGL